MLGAELVYFICLLGGFLPLRTPRAMEFHHMVFETLPGFVWINVESVILGVIYSFIFSWIFAWYYVWMHNSSLVDRT